MGRTFRGLRKKFGAKKTQDHRTRSKWTFQNGTRLRSLATDISDFQEIAGEDAEIFHRPPNLGKKREKEISHVIDLILKDKSEPSKKTSAPKQKSKATLVSWLTALSTEELEARKAFASQQCRHLHRVLLLLKQESIRDSSFVPAIERMSERKKHWDKLTGTTGQILSQRQAQD